MLALSKTEALTFLESEEVLTWSDIAFPIMILILLRKKMAKVVTMIVKLNPFEMLVSIFTRLVTVRTVLIKVLLQTRKKITPKYIGLQFQVSGILRLRVFGTRKPFPVSGQPIDCFNKILNDALFDLIVKETNDHANGLKYQTSCI